MSCSKASRDRSEKEQRNFFLFIRMHWWCLEQAYNTVKEFYICIYTSFAITISYFRYICSNPNPLGSFFNHLTVKHHQSTEVKTPIDCPTPFHCCLNGCCSTLLEESRGLRYFSEIFGSSSACWRGKKFDFQTNKKIPSLKAAATFQNKTHLALKISVYHDYFIQ